MNRSVCSDVIEDRVLGLELGNLKIRFFPFHSFCWLNFFKFVQSYE